MELKVAVIGAGLAGICTARQLRAEGDHHHVVVFEKTNQIGGTWFYDPRADSDPLGLDPNREVVHTSMYQNLRINFPRQLMGFSDYPFTRRLGEGDPRDFPGHQEVLHFLNGYARHFGLVDLIRFGHEVVRVEPLTRHHKEPRWVVEWRRNDDITRPDNVEVEIFDAVVICNGKCSEPRVAHFSGMDVWPGVQIHSHNYRVPDPFKDKIVVVIGNATSAFEILRDVASVAKQLHQVSRTPNPMFANVNTNGVAIHNHSMIKCGHEDGQLDFEDGSSIHADAIIHCTGYKIHVPFLKTNGIVQIEDNRVGPLYQHVFPPNLAPWLSFVGLTSMTTVSVTELQSKWIAKVLSGNVRLASEEKMMNWVHQFYQQLEDGGCPNHHTHKLQNAFEYEKWLVEEMGLPVNTLNKWREKLFGILVSLFKIHGAEYRDAIDIDDWIQQQQQTN